MVLTFYLQLLLLTLSSVASSRKVAHEPRHGLTIYDVAYAEKAAAQTSPPQNYTIEMPVDHFNASDDRTYQNRYWVNDTYYQPGGPVFLYDAGEGGVTPGLVLVILSEIVGNSTPMALAQKYNGVAIVWEHRFYGESLPFKLDSNGIATAGLDAYKYLTNEQALEDAVYLAQHFKPPTPALQSYWQALSPNSTPWVFIGGSYPGARAAMIRERNPETWFASWASSAPVEAQVDMSVYFNPMQQSMTSNCTADVHAAIDYADGVLLHGSEKEIDQLRNAIYMTGFVNPLKNVTLLNVTGPYAASAAEFSLWDVAQILAYAFELSPTAYQSNGFATALLPFCNYLEQYNPSSSGSLPSSISDPDAFVNWLNNSFDAKPTAAGIAATHNASTALNALLSASYAKMLDDNSTSSGSSSPFAAGDTASWTWQYCNEFGYFQTANASNPHNLISIFNNVSSEEQNFCKDTFSYAPAFPNVSAIVSKYGGWKMSPSNVMFSNGEVDPWRTLGVQADKKINPSAYVRNSTKEVPLCNQPPKAGEVFGQVYPGQVHAQDIIKVNYGNRTGVAPFDAGFELFTKAFDAWKPCFSGQPEIQTQTSGAGHRRPW